MKRFTLIAALLLGVASLASASAQTTINFGDYYGAQVSSVDGVTFNTAGGPGPDGAPCACSFGDGAIGNSTTGGYPTTEALVFTFSSPVSNLSFLFNNYGDNGTSFYTAYDGSSVVSSVNIGYDNYVTEDVDGSGITSLVIDNGFGGESSWEFGVYSVSFTGANAPEPASFVTLGTGLIGVAGSLYRRRRSSK